MVHATTRLAETMGLPWPDTAKASFLAAQFTLQHDHFVNTFPAADFLIAAHRGAPAGRLYVDRTSPTWRLVDISILPVRQRHGAGTALLRWLQRAARDAGASGIDLHVARDNDGAGRLYARLGFVEALSAHSTHRRMTWSAAVS